MDRAKNRKLAVLSLAALSSLAALYLSLTGLPTAFEGSVAFVPDRELAEVLARRFPNGEPEVLRDEGQRAVNVEMKVPFDPVSDRARGRTLANEVADPVKGKLPESRARYIRVRLTRAGEGEQPREKFFFPEPLPDPP